MHIISKLNVMLMAISLNKYGYHIAYEGNTAFILHRHIDMTLRHICTRTELNTTSILHSIAIPVLIKTNIPTDCIHIVNMKTI